MSVALLALAGLTVAVGQDAGLATLIEEHPGRVHALFERLDLETSGLSAVRERRAAGDLVGACEALIEHYRQSPRVADVQRIYNNHADVVAEADDVLQDVFWLLNKRAPNPRRANGGLDWNHTGPDGDKEWAFTLNWHLSLLALLGADHLTGDPRYARAAGELVADWVLANPAPSGAPQTHAWRSLEAAMRIGRSWPPVFYGFVASPNFPAAAKILMLSSIPEHGDVVRRHHSNQGNHVLIEMVALAEAAASWPEFRDGGAWLRYALDKAESEMLRQVYPDGAQKELSNHYQCETTHYFEKIARIARVAGGAMSPEFERRLERMWNHIARVAKPSGRGPINNDADVEDNAGRLRQAVDGYEREDWRFVASRGAEGTPPPGPPSIHFPWAGQVVMRSGWGPEALWSLFDVGPSGMAHAHYDRLHLSVSAFGRDFLVDNGRYHHKVDALREYFKGPRGHNVVRVDGKRQQLRPRLRGRPHDDHVVFHERFDFAAGEIGFEDADPRLRHRRAVLRYGERYWLVVDLVLGFGVHDVEALWHFHPDLAVVAEGSAVSTLDDGEAGLSILPIGDVDWDVEIAVGQIEPSVQGWFSERYNQKLPAAAAVYRARERTPALFAWLIVPRRQARPTPRIERLPAAAGTLRVLLRAADGSREEIAVRMHGDRPVELSEGLRIDGELAVAVDSILLHPAR